jgi:FAD/FMN-containing dehydrogenase
LVRTALDPSAEEQLRPSLRGELLQPGVEGYDDARTVFNGMIDRKPRFVVRPVDTADVIACVNFARTENLLLSIRGGGHGVPGFATNDDGLVIDLSRMKGIRVDPRRETVRAQGGCTWGDVDHATHTFGLATPGGVVSTTGIAGLTLGGGIGHLTRKCGLSCDNLISADVVTVEGEFVVASEKENSDLLWALRGGGGNFGVVTSFEFKLHPVSTVYAGPILWPLDKASDAMKFYREYIADAPEDVNALFVFLMVPPSPPFPEHLHNRTMCGTVVCYSGPMDKAEEVVRPIREFGPPAFELVGPMPFPMLQSAFDAVAPSGLQNYWKAEFLTELSDDVIEAHLKFAPGIPTIYSGVHTFPVNGAAHKVGRNETAWSYRDAHFAQVIFALYPDAADTPKNTEWVREYWSALHPYSAGGAYVNFLMDEGEERIAASYRDNYQRLVEVKNKYDPTNLFHMNQNIKPTA